LKILLTGCEGQVGWELARSLLPLGEIISSNRNEMDFTRPDSMRAYVRQTKPDVIVNAAAWTDVELAESEEATATIINGDAPGVLAEEARQLNALLVHYSTDYVYDGSKSTPYTETDVTNPISAYGRSKLAGERAIRDSGCDHLIFRTSWVYSARRKNFLLSMLRLMQDREVLNVINDQHGAPTWARSIAENTAHAVKQTMAECEKNKFESDIYHLVDSGTTTWHGFAGRIAELAKADRQKRKLSIREIKAISTSDYPTKARRPANSRLDTTKLEQHFNLSIPAWDLALKLCMQELIEHL